jgi:hypothetical protein
VPVASVALFELVVRPDPVQILEGILPWDASIGPEWGAASSYPFLVGRLSQATRVARLLDKCLLTEQK